MRVLPRQALASELKEKHGANYEVSYVVADFVNADDAAWARIASEVRAVDVGMLFNNVGMSYPHAEFLHNLDATLVDDLIRVNVECTTKMTRIVLPGMVQRKSGAIVNVGSGAATVLPSDPLYAVYAGAKGYVDQFSRTLYSEYRRDGIDVQLQAPLFVVSPPNRAPSGTTRASAAVPCIVRPCARPPAYACVRVPDPKRAATRVRRFAGVEDVQNTPELADGSDPAGLRAGRPPDRGIRAPGVALLGACRDVGYCRQPARVVHGQCALRAEHVHSQARAQEEGRRQGQGDVIGGSQGAKQGAPSERESGNKHTEGGVDTRAN